MATDPLADLLRGLRFRGAMLYLVSGSEGWAASAPVAGEVAEALLPGLEHVMAYHFVVRGRAWAVLEGHEPVPVVEGEAVKFPQGDAHVMTRPLPIHLCGLRETSEGE